MNIDQGELNAIQRIENQVYRTIAQVPTFTPVEGLRAQIGASSCKE